MAFTVLALSWDDRMYAQEDWLFRIRGREVIARVESNEEGGWTVTRFRVEAGPSLTDFRLPVTSQAEAEAGIENALVLLLGPSGERHVSADR